MARGQEAGVGLMDTVALAVALVALLIAIWVAYDVRGPH
jgi:hypothetical protein